MFSISENMFSNSVHTGIDGHPDTNIDDFINYIDLTESIWDNEINEFDSTGTGTTAITKEPCTTRINSALI